MRQVGGDAILGRPQEDIDALASFAEDPRAYAEPSQMVWLQARILSWDRAAVELTSIIRDRKQVTSSMRLLAQGSL
ncbi:MAG: hypothetical protein ABJA74_13080, partial [Lapillicoccus sp.]